ncbi:adenylosuccinate lyase [Natronorarus salvus]|uniref:adenylosuccinate lyase n=1 Tax=Natronorarus salvus TaxID=3117733 RepID=UPI002F264D92
MTDARRALDAVSPLDGRYATKTERLVPYASEAALMRARTRVEVEYLLALSELPETPFSVPESDRERFRAIYGGFDDADADLVKRIEVSGTERYDATNHDVKAVEYFLRERLGEELHPWIHFGLTSEDVNNLAHRLLLRAAVEDVLLPSLSRVRSDLRSLATEHRDVPMLAHTHGQPATPTTFGKEMAVYVSRLDRAIESIESSVEGLSGKLAGASGVYAAHVAAYPDVDWRAFSEGFVTDLGLRYTPLATQVNPCDDLAHLFDALRRANSVLLDLDRDVWEYVSRRYLGQRAEAGETGSSTMPHKVNPIDFENSEGNLSKANSDLVFLADYVTTSRLQRDLSDSTVKRTIGSTLAHCLIGYEKAGTGLSTIVPNEAVMAEDLERNPEVLGEAIQTILRREGHADAYERVKALTRGRRVSLPELRDAIGEMDVGPAVRGELLSLAPEGYVGLASELVDEVADR